MSTHRTKTEGSEGMNRTPARPKVTKSSKRSSASSASSAASSIFDRESTPNTPTTQPSPSSDITAAPIDDIFATDGNKPTIIQHFKVPHYRRSASATQFPLMQEESNSPWSRRSKSAPAEDLLQQTELSTIAEGRTVMSGNSKSMPKSRRSSKISNSQDNLTGDDSPPKSPRHSPSPSVSSETGSTRTIFKAQVSQESKLKKSVAPVQVPQTIQEGPNYKGKKSKTPFHIKRDIYNHIIGKRRPDPKEKVSDYGPKTGLVYLFTSEWHGKDHVKIGCTKRDPAERSDEISKKCAVDVLVVEDEHLDWFEHFVWLETHLHISLYNKRKVYRCPYCKSGHDEWFELSIETAKQQIKLWRTWILEQKPFDEQGKLNSYWAWRARQVETSLTDVSWEEWTQPSTLDFIDYQLSVIYKDNWENLKKHFARKDFRFVLIGIIYMLIARLQLGPGAMFWTFVALVFI